MNLLLRLFGFSSERREAPGAASLAPPPAADPAPPVPVQPTGDGASKNGGAFGPSDLERLLWRLNADSPAEWAGVLHPCMVRHGITTPRRIAAFVANILHETGGLTRLVESMNYAVEALPGVFGPHRITAEQAAKLGRINGRPADQKGIACQVYGGEWGFRNLGNLIGSDDGWRFRGHGLLQLTGRANFTRFGGAIGRTADELPAILCTREGAAESAAHFFSVSGCNALADRGDIIEVRRRINGGRHGLPSVERHYHDALSVLGGAGESATAQ